MRILAVSDYVDDRLYSVTLREDLPTVELVLGCGDLPYDYLEFLVSVLNVPLLYIPGNHNPEYNPSHSFTYAEGCEYIDLRVIRVKGVLVAGLGGSILYKPNTHNQYSQFQMWQRAITLALRLIWTIGMKKKPLDIMIAHSPPWGIHEDKDPAHVGFISYLWLIRIFQPRYFLHGHTTNFRSNLDGSNKFIQRTEVINVNPYKVIEMAEHGH